MFTNMLLSGLHTSSVSAARRQNRKVYWSFEELRSNVLSRAPSGDHMCVEYGRVLQRLLAERIRGVR